MDEFKSHRTPASKCPCCDAKLDAATGIGGDTPPDPGSFSICSYCKSLLVYDNDLALRKVTNEDLDELDPEKLAFLQKVYTKITEQF